MSKLTYIRCGDYDIPNLKLSEQPETSIGKYGRMRKSYLKEHRPILYNQLLMSEKLYPHLLEIDRTAQERMDTMLPHMMEAAGVTEEQEELRKKEERKDRLHQNYLKRKASGAQKRYEDKIKAKKKAEMDAKKSLIRAEDMKKGVYSTVSQLPKEEPRKGSIAASAAV